MVLLLEIQESVVPEETLLLHFLQLLPLLVVEEVLVLMEPGPLADRVVVVVEMAGSVDQELRGKVMAAELDIQVENLVETVLVVVVLLLQDLMDLLLDLVLEEMENQVSFHMVHHHQ
jgi:hypothetical protein